MTSTEAMPPGRLLDGRNRVARVCAWLLLIPVLTLFLRPGSLAVPEAARTLVSQIAYLVPFALAVAFCGLAARRARDAERRFWALLGLACALVLANEAVAAAIVVRGDVLKSVALGPVFTVAAAAVFVTLLITVTRMRIPSGISRARYWVDAFLVAMLTFSVSLVFVVQPLFSRYQGISQSNMLLAALNPVIAIVVFGGTLTNLLGLQTSGRRIWEWLCAAGIGTFAIALILWPGWYISYTYTHGPLSHVIESMWALGHHLVFMAALYRITSADDAWGFGTAPVNLRNTPWFKSLLLGIASLAAALVVLDMHSNPQPVLTPPQAAAMTLLVGAAVVVRTALVAAENRALRGEARLDPVTGLPNHRSFHEVLAEELALAEKFGDVASLAIIDIDSFGSVNELMGHPDGDRMLATIGNVIAATAPAASSVCRTGGDEFAVVMLGLGYVQAAEACERIRDALASVLCPALPKVTASIGIASYPVHALVKDDIVRFADGALYWAKLHGKDQVVVYDAGVVEALGTEDRIELIRREHMIGTMRALASAVDARDPGTRFHSRTVAALAVRLAEDMGLDPERVRMLEAAATLHDVGKIGVSDAVLGKPGALTEMERRHVQEHALLAERILSATALSQIVPWVVAHHERWDGRGYPYGLEGELIPLEARILAICDAYDAMVSGRPYRSALSTEAALQEIDLNIGTQFDPRIAERFIRLIQSEDERARQTETRRHG